MERINEVVLAEKFAVLLPHLDERQRRLVLGADARAFGHGGIRLVARAAGVSQDTVSRGVAELESGAVPTGRVRAPGAGRKALREKDPELVAALLALVEPDQRGDPESPLRWTVKSTRRLAEQLTAGGHPVGADTVGALLRAQGFSLQGTSRTTEGARHPDRDGQFRYINERVKEFTAAGQPVVSVDTKKKEVLGDYAVAGREWHRAGQPVRVRAHDFPEKNAQKAVPYGVYDLTADTGWVSVGCDGDTAAFAVATLRRWWDGEGRHRYPTATRLLITADAGGANGYRVRAWKKELADLARTAGLQITVCHFPPGTSKWNKIEHRLFSRISTNWRGRPLTSHEVVVNTIGATTTRTGLTVHAELDPGAYPTGLTVPDEVMDALALTAHDWHGQWNYTLVPAPPRTVSTPASRYVETGQPDDRAPDWLHHPTITGMDPGEFTALLAAAEQYILDHPPISLHHKRARHRVLRRGPLSLSDRLLVTLIHHRWKTQQQALTRLLGSPRGAVGDAIHEMTPVLDGLDRRIQPAPITAPTVQDLTSLIDPSNIKNGSY